jgi:hypothetical protein
MPLMLRAAFLAFALALAAVAAGATPDAVLPDGGRYYGPLVNGKLDGKGRLEWPNGNFYEGEFSDGMIAGSGLLRFSNGVYDGEFRDGLMWGTGELRYDNGRVYRGAFVRGSMEGKGRLQTPDGDVYEGDFSNNEFTGQGTLTRRDGARYEGAFKQWVFNGRGRFADGSGALYEGGFINGQLEGPGKASGPLGSYEGEFKGGQFNGEGVLKLPNGDVYRGGFANGLFDGKGSLTYAKPQPGGRTQVTGLWRYGNFVDEAERARTEANVESALYSERALLDKALAALKDRAPGRINLYLLAVAGDGSQEVFRREVQFVQQEFARRFATSGHAIALVNSRASVGTAPMATVASIREALRAIAARMNRDEDILFFFLTSHGSRDHVLSLHQNGMQLPNLPAPALGALLKESGIKWKVVVVSACYSGGFIAPLQDGHTLVITAARQDRASFGCADENDFTYFGRAFFKESLPKAVSFQDAFHKAEVLVDQWEKENAADAAAARPADKPGEEEHSLPQMSANPEIDAQLARWWAQLGR